MTKENLSNAIYIDSLIDRLRSIDNILSNYLQKENREPGGVVITIPNDERLLRALIITLGNRLEDLQTEFNKL